MNILYPYMPGWTGWIRTSLSSQQLLLNPHLKKDKNSGRAKMKQAYPHSSLFLLSLMFFHEKLYQHERRRAACIYGKEEEEGRKSAGTSSLNPHLWQHSNHHACAPCDICTHLFALPLHTPPHTPYMPHLPLPPGKKSDVGLSTLWQARL